MSVQRKKLRHQRSRSLSPKRSEMHHGIGRPKSAAESTDFSSKHISENFPFFVPDNQSTIRPVFSLSHEEESVYDDHHDQSHTSDSDSEGEQDFNQQIVRLSATVWKQKSGISGKFKNTYDIASGKAKSSLKPKGKHTKATSKVGHSWERRKIILDGRILMYYDKDAEVDDDPTHHSLTSFGRLAKNFLGHKDKDKDKDKKHSTSLNTPRGVIDIVKRNAVVHLSSTKYAPTPFCLSISMKVETNWTLCFDEREELMKWMLAITNVTVMRSLHMSQRNQTGGEYNHCSPASTQDKWIPASPTRAKVHIEGSPSKINGLATDQMNDTNVRDVTNVIYENEVTEKSPVIRNRRERYFSTDPSIDRYASEDSNSLTQSSASTVIPDNDFVLMIALMNISLGYICYLAIKGESIIMSYLYTTLMVNGSIFYIMSHQNDSGYGSTKNSQHQFRRFSSGNTYSKLNKSSTSSVHSLSFEEPLKNMKKENMLQASSKQTNTIQSTSKSTTRVLENNKPRAGASTIKLEKPNDSRLNKDNIPLIGWLPAPVSATQARGANYLFSKKKVSCIASLYELVETDVFESMDQMLEIGQRFDVSHIKLDYDINESVKKTWKAPDIFVISLSLPTTAPKLGRSNNDKKGIIVTGYYRMRKEVREILNIVTCPEYDALGNDKELQVQFRDENHKQMINGVKLWEKWCEKAPSDPEMQKRFKFIAKGDNLNEVGCPRWMCNYNGKPILIKKPGVTGFLFTYDNMMEFDLSLLPFPYLFKTAMTYLKENLFEKMLMTFSFIIEGRERDELPELLIGNGLQVCYVDPEHVSTAKDVFEGISPQSFDP